MKHTTKGKIAALSLCLNLISAVVLLGGLGGAVLIYQTAASDSNTVVGYEEGGGSVYPVTPDDSKAYLRDLELYGGKANVLAYQLRTWFAGLWRGKSLACIVACISVGVSFGFFYAANHLPFRFKSGGGGENNRDGTN